MGGHGLHPSELCRTTRHSGALQTALGSKHGRRNTARIAVVEDDETVAESLAYSLRRVGHHVDVFDSGDEAARELDARPPDLAVLDLALPGMDGLEICRRLRIRHPRLPIIILTARAEEVDRVLGLESGADDYVVKPFSLREVEARVKALLRRAAPPPVTPGAEMVPLRCGRFVLDRRLGEIRMDERPLNLSPREEDLLRVLMESGGAVVSREDIMSSVWGPDYVGEAKTLDVHVRWLRLKIEEDAANPRHVLTVRGKGYRFEGG